MDMTPRPKGALPVAIVSIAESTTIEDALRTMVDTGSEVLVVVPSAPSGAPGVVTRRDMIRSVMDNDVDPTTISVRNSVWRPMTFGSLSSTPSTPRAPHRDPSVTRSNGSRRVFRLVDTEDE